MGQAQRGQARAHVQDGRELLEVRGAQQVRDVAHGRRGQQRERLGLHLQHLLAVHLPAALAEGAV